MGHLSDKDVSRASAYAFRHFVSFTYYARSPEIFAANNGMALPCECSGFVLSVRGNWLLVTAGHVLEEIERERESGIDLVSFRLWDSWALDAPHRNSVPFDLFASLNTRIHKDGLDYGIIALSPLYVANLSANGVVPINEDQFEKTWPITFDAYSMIGIPAKTVNLQRIREKDTRITHAIFAIRLERELNPPDVLRQPHDRFYGRINIEEDNDLWVEMGGDIRGMSGGPILGIAGGQDGLRYWVIGIQSGWLPSARVIAACYFQEFAQHVAREFDAMNDD